LIVLVFVADRLFDSEERNICLEKKKIQRTLSGDLGTTPRDGLVRYGAVSFGEYRLGMEKLRMFVGEGKEVGVGTLFPLSARHT